MCLVNYRLSEICGQLKRRGDKFDDMKRIIEWESLRPLLNDLLTNDSEQGEYRTTIRYRWLRLSSVGLFIT